MNQQETRLHDAKLGSAIDNACKKLLQEYTINICIQAGSFDVVLFDADGEECDFPTNGTSLAESITDAVEFAEAKQ
jgi:hypothetical protein